MEDPQMPSPNMLPTDPMPPDEQDNRRKKLFFIILVVVILLALLGTLYLLVRGSGSNTNNQSSSKSSSSSSQSKSKTDTQASSDSSNATADNTNTNTENTCDGTVSDTIKENVAAAVQSRNFSALVGYMASEVTLVIAASEKGGTETPAQAVDDMRYLNGTTDPWDFNLPQSTTDVWGAHYYSQYFTGSFYAGRAASDEVVSFKFDSCGKINAVFMASDYRLLETS